MAASVVVAAVVAAVGAAVVARLEVVPEAPVAAVRVGAPALARRPVRAPRALVPGGPEAVRADRPGSAVAPTSGRTHSAFACWTVAFRSRTLAGWPSC